MKKRTILLILFIIGTAIAFVIPTIIPLFKKAVPLIMGVTKNSTVSSMTEPTFEIELQAGQEYTVEVVMNSFWSTDVIIRVTTSPYDFSGKEVDAAQYTGDVMVFMASKTGKHFIHVLSKPGGGGFFDITVYSGVVGSSSASVTNYTDLTYLIWMILPGSIIIIVGIIIYLKLKDTSWDFEWDTY